MVNLKKARFCPWLDRSSFFKMCSNEHPLVSKQKSLCVIKITPIDFLLSLQEITAHRHTLLKRVHKSQSLDSKLKLSTFSAKMLVFSLSSTGLAETVVALATYSLTSVRYPTFVALYLKRAPTCIPLCLSKNRFA
ncbi:hypothetical protein HMPREF9260_01124 [Facklamia hominis ACS-120-V-Sch10]|nr:hypothetical protein HMPREF9260_01124 [Facklamia hominis ACS-120-V-Sch10]